MNLKDKITNIDISKIKEGVLNAASEANTMAKDAVVAATDTAKDVANKANELVNKATDGIVNVIDQNNDGKFDLDDLKKAASNAADAVKQRGDEAIVAIDKAKKDFDLGILKPIFKEEALDPAFKLTKFICLTNPDAKHANNIVCEGSVGNYIKVKNDTVVNIYRDSLDIFNITLYPNDDSDYYFVDPTDKNRYIDIEVYFYYLKESKVAELTRVVQELGAKTFRFIYKEERNGNNKMNVKARNEVIGIGKGDAERQHQQEEYATISIETLVEFKGQDPVEPVLKYLKNVPCVENIIYTRMHKGSPVNEYDLDIKLHETSNMKEKDALTIDATLKGMKASGSCGYVNELKSELRKHLICKVTF